MDTGVLIALVVLAVVLLALLVLARKKSAKRKEGLRIEARDHREEAEIQTSRADAQEAEAQERAARARREQAQAQEQATLARQERRAAQERHEHADRIDPDADGDAARRTDGTAEGTDQSVSDRPVAPRGEERG